jgi:hypothetical protein
MLLRTSTATAPWTIVEGNDKWFARVKALRTLVEVLSKELAYQPTEPPIKDTQTKKGEDDVAKKGKKEKKEKKGKKGKKKKK